MPEGEPATIAIRVDRIGELFESLDPYPMGERDLAGEVEEFIVGFARELPRRRPIRIMVHLPPAEAGAVNVGQLSQALSHYFLYRADGVGRDLRELFRIGRWSLLVGLSVLALTAMLDQLLRSQLPESGFLRQGVAIVGWVANWRPIQIFLYDWWPVVRRRNLFRRLAQAEVEVRPQSPAD